MNKRHFRLASFILIMIMLITCFTACATYDAFIDEFVETDEKPEETVRIGVYEPLSGKDKEKGELEKIGIELAHELYPIALNKPVELIYADNQSDIYVAEEAIQELIAQRPAVVLGSYGDIYSLAAIPYLEEAKIPAIAITNTNPLVTSHNPYYFRICFVETYQGIALAKFTVEDLKISNAAIMMPKNDDTVIAMSKSYEEKLIQMTGDENAVRFTIEYDPNQESFETEIMRLKNSDTKAVFLPTNREEAFRILTEAYNQDYKAVFMGTDEWDSEEVIATLGKAADLVAISTVYDPDTQINEMSEVFMDAYKEKYGEESIPAPEVALGFDAYIIAIDSLNRIGTALDGELLAESIGLETKFPGVSGNITLDANGDPMKSVVIKGVKNGEFVSLYTMEPIFQ